MRADLDQLELARKQLGEPAQALGHVALLEQRLLLLRLDAQRAGDHVRQLRRVLQVHDRDLQLLGEVGQLLDDPRERRLDVAVQGLELGRGDDLVGCFGDTRHEIGIGGHVLADLHALGAVDEDAHGAVRHLQHARHHAGHAHRVEALGARLGLVVAPRGHHRKHPVAGERVVDQLDRALLADGQRRERLREGHRVAQRQDRQRIGHGRAHLRRHRLTLA